MNPTCPRFYPAAQNTSPVFLNRESEALLLKHNGLQTSFSDPIYSKCIRTF